MLPVNTIDTENVQTTRTNDATEESTIFDQNNTSVDNLEDIVSASEELDISVETYSGGRRILPSRCGTSSPTNPTISSSSPVEEDISTLLDRSSSPPPIRKRKSLVSSLLPDPKRTRQESSNSDDDKDVPSSPYFACELNLKYFQLMHNNMGSKPTPSLISKGGYQIPPPPLGGREIDTPWEIGLKGG